MAKLLTPVRIVNFTLALACTAGVFLISNPSAQNVASGIAASFIFILVLDIIDLSRTILEKRHIKKFFGKSISSNEMYLTYPSFVISKDVMEYIATSDIFNPQLIFSKQNAIFMSTNRIDIPNAVAENDLQALVYVAAFLGEVTGSTPPVCEDCDLVETPNRSFISFGLSSNECTHMYLDHASLPSFTLIDKNNDFHRGTEFVRISGPDGDKIDFISTETINYGVILKYLPSPSDHPERCWFLCAGLGPKGTTGAAWFLANKWKKIYDEVSDKEFLAIVRVPHYSDLATKLELLAISPHERSSQANPIVFARSDDDD